MKRLILNALKSGEEVRIGKFRLARVDHCSGDIEMHARMDGTGYTRFDLLTTSGLARQFEWIKRTVEECKGEA